MEPVKEIAVTHFTRRYALQEKTCPVCGEVFQGNRLATYCGRKCAKKAANTRFYQTQKAKEAQP